MKKALIILGTIIGLFFLSLILIPILFKGQIFDRVKGEAGKSINAELNLSQENFNLSLFSNFPNLSISLNDFSIVGRDVFIGDTLFAAKNTTVEIDLFKVLQEDKISIKGISLQQPLINILVLEDGTANYDIAISNDEAEQQTKEEETSDFTIGIDHWSLQEGRIMYYDQSAAVALNLSNVNHEGSGDFTLSEFDMNTTTSVEDMSFAYDGDVYISHKSLTADMLFGMNLDAFKFTFKDATAKINELELGFEGFFAMPTEDYEMDIRFSANNNSFKSVLSLVPGMYADGFDALTTQGDFDLDGSVKGIYNEKSMPSYSLNLVVKDGYVKSNEIPLPVEKINTTLSINNPSGEMKDGSLAVSNYSMVIEDSPFTASASVKNFDSPSWNIQANGKLNLDVISKIEPTTDFSLGGLLSIALNSKGNYEAVEAEEYTALETNGNLQLTNFSYESLDYPKAEISSADLNFTPQQINLNKLNARFGESDFSLEGSLQNYLAYLLQENGILIGVLQLNSQLLNLNEFMADDSDDTNQSEDTTELELVIIPKNINFVFDASVATILYDDYKLKNAAGRMEIKDGILNMQPLRFDMLGGSINLAGTYDTSIEDDPRFSAQFKMNKVGIQESFQQFSSIQKFVPVAEKMKGQITTDFGVSGKLMQDMMPDLSSVSGKGIIKVLEAAVTDSKLISGVTSLTKLDKSDQVTLSDVLLRASIEDGKLRVEPFDFNFGQYKANVGGTTSLDGSIDYRLKLNIPSGTVGKQANAAISNLLGTNTQVVGDEIKLNFAIGGTYEQPNVNLLGGDTESSTKAAAKNLVDNKLQEGKQEIKQKVETVKDSAKTMAVEAKDSAEAVLKKEAEKKKEELKKKAKKKLKNLFGDG